MMTLYSRWMPGPGTFRTRCVLLAAAGLGLCAPASAMERPVVPICNESAPAASGPVQLEMSLVEESVPPSRPDDRGRGASQNPVRNSVKFDGYLATDGAPLRIGNGRAELFDPRTDFSLSPDASRAVPETVSRDAQQIDGSFSAVLDPDHGIVVKPQIMVTRHAGDRLGKSNMFIYDRPMMITGLRCATQVDLEFSDPVAREGQPQRHIFLHISAYRAR
ncbi:MULTISPECIES: hypothetical protein [Asaia]|uniref:Uncharacterized protein n=1 Tax=Asaia bogorensis TaxID=91915 RepID=A0A060QIP3_9PROT|nr:MULTISPECIES: hypothetical protein [Asaia]ETC99273.1 hypothetical protein P792_04875 [Asaia sp. SF2.1]CDG41044.1 hypothetical protein ASAP_2999 [Asaia bogorensis]